MQLRISNQGGAQWRTCATCPPKPVPTSEIKASGARVMLADTPTARLLLSGAYDLTMDGTAVHLSGPAEIRAAQGRLLVTVTIPLEEYVAGVLAGEAGGIRQDQALSALAVAARTYAVHFRGRHSAEGFDLCDTTHCQDLRLTTISQRGRDAAAHTEGELLWFRGAPAATFYHRSCGGTLEDGHALQPAHTPAPYLRVQADSYCERAGKDEWRGEVRKQDLSAALQAARLPAPPEIASVRIASRTNSGRAESLLLRGAYETTVPAASLRLAVGRSLGWELIRSDAYQINDLGDRLVFFGRGQGHGVGLCQSGATVMATEGHDYREILRYYYPGAAAGLTAQGLRWSALADSHIELLTTAPDEAHLLMSTATGALREVERRTGWAMTDRPQVRVYPTVAAFRDSTGEPGFVAASTRGRVVRLQPARELQRSGVLESTLRHEFAHILLESRARAGLPLWFREGVALCVAEQERCRANTPTTISMAALERQLRSPRSPEELRRAYAAASARVGQLMKRHGEQEVLRWVERGLPGNLDQSPSSR